MLISIQLFIISCLLGNASSTPKNTTNLQLPTLGFVSDIVFPTDFPSLLIRWNNGRRHHAEEYKIANMHKLHWDRALAELSASTCTSDISNLPGRLVPWSTDPKFIAESNKLARFWDKDDKTWPQTLGMIEIFLHPLQSRIGCAYVHCDVVFDTNPKPINVGAFCIMGPHRSYRKTDLVEGVAGTGCEELEMSRENGLCTKKASGARILMVFVVFMGFLTWK